MSSKQRTKELLKANKAVAEFLLARENMTWDVVSEEIPAGMKHTAMSRGGLENWWLRAHGKEKRYADVVLVALYFAYPDADEES